MNILKSIGTRTAELWRNNKTDIALGALSLGGIITLVNIDSTNTHEVVTNTIPAVAAEVVHAVDGEWPGWTPEGVKPVTDMTGVEIGDLYDRGSAIDLGTIDQSQVPLQIATGE
jgi:hypothetical protein